MARTYILRTFCFVCRRHRCHLLFSCVFGSFSSFLLSSYPRPFVQFFFDMPSPRPRPPHAVSQQLSVSSFILSTRYFLHIGGCRSFRVLCTVAVSIFMESTRRTVFFRMVFFNLVTTGCILSSINQNMC